MQQFIYHRRVSVIQILLFYVVLVQSSSIFRNDIQTALLQSGCTSSDGIPLTSKIVACSGTWFGDVHNANGLCSSDFKLCTYQDESLLKEIPWADAIAVEGCYAIDASQSSGHCGPCNRNSSTNILAGIGSACGFRSTNPNQNGCIPGGRIDSHRCSNCSSCTYDYRISGALCCRRSEPDIQKDQPLGTSRNNSAIQIVHVVGERLTLTCPLQDASSLQIIWTKNNVQYEDSLSNRLFFKMLQVSDTGMYTCYADKRHSNNPSVSFNVTVLSVQSQACADGTSEGFHTSEHVRGCAGRWTGHVKRAERRLCAKGWRVCSTKDRSLFQNIDSSYLTNFGGCFAYNAAHVKDKCRRCQNKFSMAALGADCFSTSKEKTTKPLTQQTSDFCYANRRIQAFSDKFVSEKNGEGCMYHKDQGISGVLCCAKRKFRFNGKDRKQTFNQECTSSTCLNGGSCVDKKCVCSEYYSGQFCQIRIFVNDEPYENENRLDV